MVRTVHDPELPYLTVEEMGMVRGVSLQEDQIVVSLTPTYSGCPATDVISEDIEKAVSPSTSEHAVVHGEELRLSLEASGGSPGW
mgnify:CR=1 FL=1